MAILDHPVADQVFEAPRALNSRRHTHRWLWSSNGRADQRQGRVWSSPMITIGKLEPSDRAQWEVLFRGYMDFYERTLPQAMYDRAWN